MKNAALNWNSQPMRRHHWKYPYYCICTVYVILSLLSGFFLKIKGKVESYHTAETAQEKYQSHQVMSSSADSTCRKPSEGAYKKSLNYTSTDIQFISKVNGIFGVKLGFI